MGRASTTNAPDPGPRDWALVAALVGWSLVEVVLRRDLAPGPVLLLYALAVIGPPSTVKAHLASLMRKLGARNRVEVAMWAHETGRI